MLSAGPFVDASGPERLAAFVPGGAATPRPRSLAVCLVVFASSFPHPPPCTSLAIVVVVASTAPARHHHSFGAVAATFVFFPILSLLLSGHGQSLLWALPFFIPIALSPRGQPPPSGRLAIHLDDDDVTSPDSALEPVAIPSEPAWLQLVPEHSFHPFRSPGPVRFQLSTGASSRTVHDNDSHLPLCISSSNTSGRLSRL